MRKLLLALLLLTSSAFLGCVDSTAPYSNCTPINVEAEGVEVLKAEYCVYPGWRMLP